MYQGVRTLLSAKTLGISEYETHRQRIRNFKVNKLKLKFEMERNNTDAVTQTIKQWIHVMAKDECVTDLELLQICLRHIYQNTESSTVYDFGPTVMRMLHFLNLPNQALQVIQIEYNFIPFYTYTVFIDKW